MKSLSLPAVAVLLSSLTPMCAAEKPGFTDTPVITGQTWRVHDADRPQPRIVTPASFSHNAKAPSDAIVLFDGTDLSKWTKDGGPAPWKIVDGAMEVVGKSGSIETREKFGSFQLHLEFATPNPPSGDGQARANSGVFLHGLYEIQVLDCYQNPTYADGTVGCIYGQWPPLANAANPPGQWNAYDILFQAPRVEAGRVVEPARVTVLLNGVVTQHAQAILGPVRHREVAAYEPNTPTRGPIGLQDHGDPVRFRNIWVRPLGEYDKPLPSPQP